MALVVMMLLPMAVLAQTPLEKALSSLPSVMKVEKLESSVFREKFVLRFQRPVNPEAAGEMTPEMQTYTKYLSKEKRAADAGTFLQRVIVCHRGFNRPTLVVTEGYGASYALRPNYQEELSRLLDMNIVVVEYRYFGESCPEEMDWDYLTVGNSLSDLHQIVTTLKSIYAGKWVSTGVSKGGMTTMFYRAYYPNDVTVSVPYVAPLNKRVEDGRHESFLSDKVGTPEERAIVQDYMMDLAENRSDYLPLLESYCKEQKLTFRVPLDEVWDLCILELRYALWQYGTPRTSVPGRSASKEDKFKFLVGIAGPDYFSQQGSNYSFFVMAAKELGYYGYDLTPFKKYMSVSSTKDYLKRVMLHESEENLKFDNRLYKHTVRFLKDNDPKMAYIYGGIDPWGASGVCTWLDTSKKQNLKIYVNAPGSHSTNIRGFGEPMTTEILDQIKSWLGL